MWWVYARAERLAAIKRPLAGGAVVAENLFYWDALYRRIAYLPASLIATALYRGFERWIIWGSVSLVAYVVRAFSRAATAGPERRRAPVRHRVRGGRGGARRLLPGDGVAVTTALIFLPLAGALLVALLPLPRRLTEGLALLVALAECGLGAAALIGFEAQRRPAVRREPRLDLGLRR